MHPTTTLPTALRRLDTATKRKHRPPNEALLLSPVQYNLFQEYNTTISSWKTLPETQFCGQHARIASQEHGLMAPLSHNSRVVVTGLLQPLGVALALRLHKDCGVSTIIGVDALLPNVRMERMKYMERYAILQKAIPNLHRLLVPEMGLPLDDIVKRHQPTHIVHLSQQRHYQENLLSMQQLCDLLVQEKKLHLVFVSSSADELSEGANQVVASTYHALHGISAVGLRLPEIYGYPDDNNSPMSQLVVRFMSGNTTTTTTNGTVVERDCLFVDDAVDALVAGMQFRPTELTTLSIPSNITTSMLSNELSKMMTLSENPTVMTGSSSRKLRGDQARHWLGWTPSTTLQQGVSRLISLHLANKYPYGDVVDDFGHNLTSFHVPLSTIILPQRVVFPCASECSRRKSCEATVFDEVAKVSKMRSRGCKYVLYAVNLLPELNGLPSSGSRPSPENPVVQGEEEDKFCRIAFVSNRSPLVKQVVVASNKNENPDSLNGQLKHNNWTLIWVNGDATTMSEAEFTVLKLSPKRFFSTSVSRAVYVDPFKLPIPPYEYLDRFVTSMEMSAKEARRQREYRSGTNIFRMVDVPPQRARRIVFASLQDMTLGEIPPRSPVFTHVQHFLKRDGIIRPDKLRLQAQQLLYSYAAHFVQTNPRRPEDEIRSTIYHEFPFFWLRTAMIVHDLREEAARQLRCEWYDEHLYWGNTHLEDLALAYVLARRRIMGQLAPEDGAGWTPMLPMPVKGTEAAGPLRFLHDEERLVNAEGMELFLGTLFIPLPGEPTKESTASTS
jgi:nucleoside-diphosphate-sugar epimerase